MSKFKVYGTKKDITVEVSKSCTMKDTMKEIRQKAKKQRAGKILQINNLDPCI